MDFYERIEELRNKEGISQAELEKLLDFSNGSISKWKNSVPKADRLQKIAEHFNVTVDYILTGKKFPDGILFELHTLDENAISDNMERLAIYYNKLNELGKEKTIEYMNDLLESDKYTNNEEK